MRTANSLRTSDAPSVTDFCRPVRECKAQALNVRMLGTNLRLDSRHLLAAAGDSYSHPQAFFRDLVEASPIALQLGRLTAERLPALNDHIDELRVELNPQAHPVGEFGG